MLKQPIPTVEKGQRRVYIQPFINGVIFSGSTNWSRREQLPEFPIMLMALGDEGLGMNVYVHPETPATLRALADFCEDLLQSLAEAKVG